MSKNNKTAADRVQAVWDILGGDEGADRLISGEIMISEPDRTWREEDSVIYFSVTSDGTTGKDWIKHPENNDFHMNDCAKDVLCSPDFKPTYGITTEVAVFRGILFENSNRIIKKIRAKATRKKFTKPNAEVACLIRKKFTDEKIKTMGLRWIVVMHEPIKDSNGSPLLLSVGRRGGESWTDAYFANPDSMWPRVYGFAFTVFTSRAPRPLSPCPYPPTLDH